MSFTLHIELADFGGRPVPGAEFAIAPASSCFPQLSFEGTTDAAGVVDVAVTSVPGATWTARSTGRGSFSFVDPGEGNTVNLARVLSVA